MSRHSAPKVSLSINDVGVRKRWLESVISPLSWKNSSPLQVKGLSYPTFRLQVLSPPFLKSRYRLNGLLRWHPCTLTTLSQTLPSIYPDQHFPLCFHLASRPAPIIANVHSRVHSEPPARQRSVQILSASSPVLPCCSGQSSLCWPFPVIEKRSVIADGGFLIVSLRLALYKAKEPYPSSSIYYASHGT